MAATKNAIRRQGRATGKDFYEEAEIQCPHCHQPECAVHVASMHSKPSPHGPSVTLMLQCWTACGRAFEMRLMTGVGSMILTLFNLHERRDVRADPGAFVVVDPPPAWRQYIEKKSA